MVALMIKSSTLKTIVELHLEEIMSERELLDKLRIGIAGSASNEEIVDISQEIVDAGISARLAIDEATIAIREVGDAFECGDKFLPELMIAAKKMEGCLETLKPHLAPDDVSSSRGRVVIGTVSGDIHDLGKNLVATMLSLGGYEVTDVGINVSPFDIITTAKDKRADIIAVSALMTTSMPYQAEVIDLLKEMGNRGKYRVVVGGGPVTPEYVEEIGGNGYTEKAGGAISLCNQLMDSDADVETSKPIFV
jgi:5-methyltetrahydrofolate--homocysteine methyltransferase